MENALCFHDQFSFLSIEDGFWWNMVNETLLGDAKTYSVCWTIVFLSFCSDDVLVEMRGNMMILHNLFLTVGTSRNILKFTSMIAVWPGKVYAVGWKYCTQMHLGTIHLTPLNDLSVILNQNLRCLFPITTPFLRFSVILRIHPLSKQHLCWSNTSSQIIQAQVGENRWAS